MMGRSNWVAFCVWFVLGLAMILTAEAPSPSPTPSPRPPKRAFFGFGDSLVDSGNNNYLMTIARADSPPYGIDFPTHQPTGRFCNGLNIPDILSQQIGSESPLPYLSPDLTGEKLLAGANFASAGIGILDDTGIQFVNIIRISQQLNYFQEYQERLSEVIGGEKTEELVKQSVVLISLGGNDFVNNYFLIPFSLRSLQFTLPQFVNYLISEYHKILQRLYEMGARKVIVTGTGPLGCSPAELGLRSKDGECASELQQAATLYNPRLVRIVNALNRKIGTHVFIAANAQQIHMDFITNPQAYGFITSKVACCGQGPYNGLGPCTTASALCPNRDLYVFWDAFHPSERANKLIVKQIMAGSAKYMTPVNLSTLMAMD